MIYVVVYAISVLLIYIVYNKKQNKTIKAFLILGALSFPIILAGMRKIGIGTDTVGYAKSVFQLAMNSRNLTEFFSTTIMFNFTTVTVSKWELGYVLFVYFITKLFHSYQIMLAVTHAIIIVLIYKGLHVYKNKISVWLGMLIFYFLFYASSLNLMRQWMAISIVFFAFQYLLKNMKKTYIVLVLLATSFHYSAILGLAIMFLYYFLINDKKKYITVFVGGQRLDSTTIKIGIILFGGIALLFSIPILSRILSAIGLSRYASLYLIGSVSFKSNQIIRRIPFIFLVLYGIKKDKSYANKKLNAFFGAMMVLDIIAAQFGSLVVEAERIGYYFYAVYYISIPYYINKVSKRNKHLIILIVIVYLILSFAYDIIFQGRSSEHLQ